MTNKYQKEIFGLTLVELLITLGILSVLLSLGYANYRSYAQKQGVISAARAIMTDLRQIEGYAFSGKKPSDASCASPAVLNSYKFKVNGTTQYSFVAVCSGVEVIVKNVNVPNNVSILLTSSNPSYPISEIVFKPLGSGTNIQPGVFAHIIVVQTDNQEPKTIVVGSGGDVSLLTANE